MALTTSRLEPKKTQEIRTNCLVFANKIISQLQIRNKTRDEILFLIGHMIAQENYEPKNPELLCVSSIIFILKFENDFSEKFKSFFYFALQEMKLDIKEIHAYEVRILDVLPSYFIFIPTFKEMIEVILKILYREKNYEKELEKLETICINKYINAHEQLSFITLIVDSVIRMSESVEKEIYGYEIVRAVFLTNDIPIF